MTISNRSLSTAFSEYAKIIPIADNMTVSNATNLEVYELPDRIPIMTTIAFFLIATFLSGLYYICKYLVSRRNEWAGPTQTQHPNQRQVNTGLNGQSIQLSHGPLNHLPNNQPSSATRTRTQPPQRIRERTNDSPPSYEELFKNSSDKKGAKVKDEQQPPSFEEAVGAQPHVAVTVEETNK